MLYRSTALINTARSRLFSSCGSIFASNNASARAKIAQIDGERPYMPRVAPALIDTFQRQHDYLRISLTEKCNLRCFYCMPEEGIQLSPKDHILSNEEVLRLATLFVKSGVTKIRLTGGEPTVRKGITEIIAGLNELRVHGLKSIAMTTNGVAIHRKLPDMIKSGLTHINISLDTMDPFKFELMARRPGHDGVLKTLDVALSSPELKSVKLNMVVVKGLNDGEVLDFVEMTKDKDLSVRFIEFMPFTGNKWSKNKMVTSHELLERVKARHSTIIRAPDELNDTARSWQIPGYKGSLGFISSMSDHFCATCNRLRITADGQIKVCLFDAKEVSLRDVMRNGAKDEQLLEIIGLAVQGKHAKHAGMENIDVVTNRPMILIGGNRVVHHRPPKYRSVFMHPATFHHQQGPSALRYASTSSRQQSHHLTHIDKEGRASMVDVSDKQPTKRSATASGKIFIPKVAYDLVTATYPMEEGQNIKYSDSPTVQKARKKGDALTVAQVAAIMGSKRTSDLIPLCHSLAISNVSVTLTPEAPRSASKDERHFILCRATVACEGKTGVEMEALTAVSVGLLTVWDMLKAVAGKEMEIGEIMVTHKSGGRSGDFIRAVD